MGAGHADWNEDGVHDPNEPGLEASDVTKIQHKISWRVELYDTSTVQLVQTSITHSEDLNGDGLIVPQTERGLFSFKHLPPGEYELVQVLPSAWSDLTLPDYWLQNAPALGGTHTVSLAYGEISSGWDFADIHTDFTGDGLWNAADIDLLFAGMAETILSDLIVYYFRDILLFGFHYTS